MNGAGKHQNFKQRNFLQPMWDGKKSLTDKRILLCERCGDTITWSSRLY